MLTTMVENFPGYRDGIMGPDLMAEMRAQAEKFGTEIIQGHVNRSTLRGPDSSSRPPTAEYTARTLIIATGASARLLGLPSERTLMGHGVSTCATCDGYFFRGQEIAVVGGGDSAMEEAMFLTRFATKVTVVHRRDTLRASKIMQDKARANPKIAWMLDHEVRRSGPAGRSDLDGRPRTTRPACQTEIPVNGVFVAIGHTPNTSLFRGQLEIDANGYIITHDGAKTSVAGVFACGDVQDHIYRQAITAAGVRLHGRARRRALPRQHPRTSADRLTHEPGCRLGHLDSAVADSRVYAAGSRPRRRFRQQVQEVRRRS